VARGGEVGYGGAEKDGLADVAPPVVRGQFSAFDGLAGDCGVKRDVSWRSLDLAERIEKVGLDRVHLGAVEGVVDLEKAVEDASGFEFGGNLAERLGLSGEGDGGGAV
jgi:hypothetical protein